jgi:hypothetical protein
LSLALWLHQGETQNTSRSRQPSPRIWPMVTSSARCRCRRVIAAVLMVGGAQIFRRYRIACKLQRAILDHGYGGKMGGNFRPVISLGWRTTGPSSSSSDFRPFVLSSSQRRRTDGKQAATALLPNCLILNRTQRDWRPVMARKSSIFWDIAPPDGTGRDAGHLILDWMAVGEGRHQRKQRDGEGSKQPITLFPATTCGAVWIDRQSTARPQ